MNLMTARRQMGKLTSSSFNVDDISSAWRIKTFSGVYGFAETRACGEGPSNGGTARSLGSIGQNEIGKSCYTSEIYVHVQICH
jgi:hypothetical protein